MSDLRLFEVPPLPETGPTKQEITEIFNYWVNAMEKSDRVKLTPSRTDRIKRALKWYPRDFIIEAIEGCKLSTYHMASASRHDISHILVREEWIELHAARYRVHKRFEAQEVREIARMMEQ